jgi:ATP-dependent RNA helicase RhlE
MCGGGGLSTKSGETGDVGPVLASPFPPLTFIGSLRSPSSPPHPAQALRDTAGTVTAYLGVQKDVTELVRFFLERIKNKAVEEAGDGEEGGSTGGRGKKGKGRSTKRKAKGSGGAGGKRGRGGGGGAGSHLVSLHGASGGGQGGDYSPHIGQDGPGLRSNNGSERGGTMDMINETWGAQGGMSRDGGDMGGGGMGGGGMSSSQVDELEEADILSSLFGGGDLFADGVDGVDDAGLFSFSEPMGNSMGPPPSGVSLDMAGAGHSLDMRRGGSGPGPGSFGGGGGGAGGQGVQ